MKRFWLSVCVVLLIAGNLLSFVRFQNDFSRLMFSSITFTMAVAFFAILMLRKPRYYYIEDQTIYSATKRTKLTDIEDIDVDSKNLVIKLKLINPSSMSLKKIYFDNIDNLKKVEEEIRKYL